MRDLQSSLRDVKVALDEQDPKQAKGRVASGVRRSRALTGGST